MGVILSFISRLVSEKYWGEVIIRFKDGKPVLIMKNEQISVTSLQEEQRKSYEQDSSYR